MNSSQLGRTNVIPAPRTPVANASKTQRRVVGACQKRGFDRLLVEENFPNQLSMIQMHMLAVFIAELLPPAIKVAFVDQNAEQNDLNAFGETVAVNRGVVGRVFMTAADAEAWLTS